MSEPLAHVDFSAFKVQVRPLGRRADFAPRARARGWRTLRVGALLLALAAALLSAAQVSQEALDAAAVMALEQAASTPATKPPASVTHDPHFVELTPIGLELVAARTRNAGALAPVDEYDYRNADGDVIVMLTAAAPFAFDEPNWSAQRVGDIRLLTWTIDGKRHVLAGHADTHGLMRAADALTLP